jgi:hypothetical protein
MKPGEEMIKGKGRKKKKKKIILRGPIGKKNLIIFFFT